MKIAEGQKYAVVWRTISPRSFRVTLIVEPLVLGVESGDRYVDELQLANRPVPAAGFDHHRRAGLNVEQLAVEFDVAGAFQEVVQLGCAFVVMGPRGAVGFDHVQRGDLIGIVEESAFGRATWASRRLQLVEMLDAVVCVVGCRVH